MGPSQFLRSAFEWRVLRNLGASLAVAGASVGVWGVLAVSTVSATASAPDCTTSPPNGACLKEAHENVTATSFGSTCDFETQGTTTDGFHFIVPASQGTGFSTLTVYFDVNGSLLTVTKTTGFIQPGGKGAVIDAPYGAILLEASATIKGGSGSGGGSDGGTPRFNLSSTCAGIGTTTTTSTTTTTTTTPTSTTTTKATTTTTTTLTTTTTTKTTTTTTTTPTTTTTTTAKTTTTTPTSTTTTTTPTTTTTTNSGTGGTSAVTTSAATSSQSSNNAGAGAGAGAAAKARAITSPNTGADLAGPFGIGLGLVFAGLALLGLSFRRRDNTS